MKDRLTFVFLFILPHIVSFAQTFNGGIHMGLAACQVAGDTYSGYNKAGFSGGLYVNHHISVNSTLQLELNYINKGSKHNPDQDNDDFTSFKISASYIELPLLYACTFTKKIKVEAGIATGFKISAKEVSSNSPASDKNFKSSTVSTILGISYLLSDRLFVNFRTNNSVFSIRNNTSTGYVKRYTSSYGQFHDVLIVSLVYQVNHPE